ncbi:MAG: hypothetical protein JAY90_18645 [Candidatus Thiodiazotropha lotti]|nr:hypothetical protein [Candidatus Thiodiazotropha lotti]
MIALNKSKYRSVHILALFIVLIALSLSANAAGVEQKKKIHGNNPALKNQGGFLDEDTGIKEKISTANAVGRVGRGISGLLNKQRKPLLGTNHRDGCTRVNSDLGECSTKQAVTAIWRYLTKNKKYTQYVNKNGDRSIRKITDDGKVQIRNYPDGSVRLDSFDRGTKKNGQTIHTKE